MINLKKSGLWILGAFLIYSGGVVFYTQKDIIATEIKNLSTEKFAPVAEQQTPQEEQVVEQAIAEAQNVESEATIEAPAIKQILGDSIFIDAITLAFGIFAFIKWIDFAAGFSPNNALSSLIVPSIATFLAFKWLTVLSWFNL